MNHPFDDYLPKNNGSSYYVKQVFEPDIRYNEQAYSLDATIKRNGASTRHNIYSLKDVINFKGPADAGSRGNFFGLIGERILSVVLDDIIGKTIEKERKKNPKVSLEGGILLEPDRHEGKGLIATWNDDFILRHKGKSNYVVLTKPEEVLPINWYQQEKSGLSACEIDGLAYLHIDGKDYLLIGESKMSPTWKNIGFRELHKNLLTRIVDPFSSLFPDHELIFTFMGKRRLIYDRHNFLSPQASNITDLLEASNVKSLFIPTPETPRTVKEYASRMYFALPVIKETLKIIDDAV